MIPKNKYHDDTNCKRDSRNGFNSQQKKVKRLSKKTKKSNNTINFNLGFLLPTL